MTTAAKLLAALALPADSAVNRRVPKKMLVENGAPTAADKRRINEGIEELFWVATLKPTTIGAPEYRDAVREYLEIAVLRLSLRARAKAARLVGLLYRAVPYPRAAGSRTSASPGCPADQGEEGEADQSSGGVEP